MSCLTNDLKHNSGLHRSVPLRVVLGLRIDRTIIFGMWALVTVIERVIGWSFPAMAGLTLL
eukprot:1322307-Amorphochlora_amoeboformis.AAC.1